VAVRSLKSGYGEFLQDAPLTDDEISQLKARLSIVSYCSQCCWPGAEGTSL